MSSKTTSNLVVVIWSLLAGAILYGGMKRMTENPFVCSETYKTTAIQMEAILHYATSKTVPQQSLPEITISFDVLKRISPCNFLVFGLGHDSLMWASFNPHGNTLFLEEDPKWVQAKLSQSPYLTAHTVSYRTKLSQAESLMSSYRSQRACDAPRSRLKGNLDCSLALSNLPDDVYGRIWDVIMIDAPKGYFPEAPGRMGAIYSSAVMARSRPGSGVTHVYLHDVNRKVEKAYAEEFLCKKYLVGAVGRLWHFEIPPSNSTTFC